jgi:predicted metal-dependent phosphoesterase TrpH
MIDLHTHSTASDGTLTPANLVANAVEANLHGLALTDHDTIDGLEEAIAAASRSDLVFVPGIEISAATDHGCLHILGLHVDHKSATLSEALTWVVDMRNERNVLIAEKLTELGMRTSVEEVKRFCHGNVVGRPHFAVFMKEKGYTRSINVAFDKYLGRGKAAYVPKQKLASKRAIEVIRASGGVPVLAHPSETHLKKNDLDRFVRQLADWGLAGIETYYPGYADSRTKQYRRLAEKYGLVESGGSDFHGAIKPGISLGRGPGKLDVPDTLLGPLADRARQISKNTRRECVGIEPT